MVLLLCLACCVLPPVTAPDVLIRGGTVYDGTNTPGLQIDVALQGDRILAVGRGLQAGPNTRIIDATGLLVAPGFIDLHTHSDENILAPRTQANYNYQTQGVTTIVTGNCGFGPIDVAAYYARLDRQGAGTNVAHLVPHNALRAKVMGNVNRPPTAEELARMIALTEKGMNAGAWGLSTGLFYTPGSYSNFDELVALAAVAGRHHGFYASHLRDEGAGLSPAVEEALAIGHSAKLPVHISHLKVSGRGHWGTASTLISRLEQARASGQQVTADQYPYLACSTTLAATVIPARFREGTQADLVARLSDPRTGPVLREAIQQRLLASNDGRDIRIARFPARPAWQGKNLLAIAKGEGKDPADIVQAIESRGGAQIVYFNMSDEDMRVILKQDFIATASDGSARVPDSTIPHPRNYGTFPRKIGRYALGEKLISVEQAIRSSTGLPADILQLPHRGYLRAGYFADIVVFDPATFQDQATYDRPQQYSTGVIHLFVNGVLVIKAEKPTGKLSGKPLRKSAP